MLGITLLVDRLRNNGLVVSGVVASAIAISQITVTGHGSSTKAWSGPLIAIAMILLLAPTLIFAQENLPTLSDRRVGLRHFAWAALAVVVVTNVIAMPMWAATGGANSLVTSKATSDVPAFVTALQLTPARPKTVVLHATDSEITYFFTRGAGIYLGDADVAVGLPTTVSQAMTDLVSGSGLTSAKTLGLYGVQYLYLQSPAPSSLVRSIDGIGGFSRLSATTSGTLWRVLKSSPRVLFVGATGTQVALDSHDVSANALVPSAGVVQLAEKYDQSWRLLLDGRPIPLERSPNDLPVFTIPQSGQVALSHDGTLRRALISIELITLIFALVMALPAGRRRRDVSVPEVIS